MTTRSFPATDDALRGIVRAAATLLPSAALLAALAWIGVAVARWSDSALLGLVAANLAFVLAAAFFPVNRPDHR